MQWIAFSLPEENCGLPAGTRVVLNCQQISHVFIDTDQLKIIMSTGDHIRLTGEGRKRMEEALQEFGIDTNIYA